MTTPRMPFSSFIPVFPSEDTFAVFLQCFSFVSELLKFKPGPVVHTEQRTGGPGLFYLVQDIARLLFII